MWRTVAKISAATIAVLAAVLFATFSLPASPLYMPTTDCRPDRGRYDSLPFGAGYAAVAHHMGCHGVMAAEENLGGVLKINTYVWRADSWPVGIVRLSFYNDTLQAKAETRLTLWASLPK